MRCADSNQPYWAGQFWLQWRWSFTPGEIQIPHHYKIRVTHMSLLLSVTAPPVTNPATASTPADCLGAEHDMRSVHQIYTEFAVLGTVAMCRCAVGE